MDLQFIMSIIDCTMYGQMKVLSINDFEDHDGTTRAPNVTDNIPVSVFVYAFHWFAYFSPQSKLHFFYCFPLSPSHCFSCSAFTQRLSISLTPSDSLFLTLSLSPLLEINIYLKCRLVQNFVSMVSFRICIANTIHVYILNI